MSEQIIYGYKDKVYLNITNKCPCACTFCIRGEKDGVGDAQNLWLEHQPDFDEVKRAIEGYPLDGAEEIVFCGYGEPTCSLEVLLATAKYIRESLKIKTRVNTNGLGNLINGRDISGELCNAVDGVSISLNCSDRDRYYKTVRPKFGIESFDKMLLFASQCKKHTQNVTLTVVDVIGAQEIEKCRKIADDLGIPLRVRKYCSSGTE